MGFEPPFQPKVGKIPLNKEQITKIFKKHDADGDGKLSWDELEAVYKELGSHGVLLRTWRTLHHADANQDGFIDLKKELDDAVDYASTKGYHCN